MRLDELLRNSVETVREWAECLVHPLEAITNMLRQYEQGQPLASVLKIWLPTFTISVVLSYPVQNLFGIEWSNFGFYAADQLVAIMAAIANGALVHLLLRMSKLKSELHHTLILYTIVLIYTPLTTLLSVPSMYATYSDLQSLKQTQPEFDELIITLLSEGMLGETSSPNYDNILIYGTSFLLALTLAAFAECVIRWYGNARHKTYVVVGSAAFIMGTIYTNISRPLRMFVAYSFIQ